MSNVEKFGAALRQQVPVQAALIDARVALLKADPMKLLTDLKERFVLPKGRLFQLWADTLGMAYVNPTHRGHPDG